MAVNKPEMQPPLLGNRELDKQKVVWDDFLAFLKTFYLYNISWLVICFRAFIKTIMEIKIKMPQQPKAKVMLWTDISYHDTEKLNKTESIHELQTALREVLEIDLPGPKQGILLDLYVQTILYCREKHFKPAQTSALISILKSIHKVNVETVINNIADCHTYCKELLLCHSVRQPPLSIDLYNSEEVTSIYKYIYNSYMRHYILYKTVFTPQVKLDMSVTYSDSLDQNVCATSENRLQAST